jgi:hypothetical protein
MHLNDLPFSADLDPTAMAAVRGGRKPLTTYDLTGGISSDPTSPNGPSTPAGALGIDEGFMLPGEAGHIIGPGG